ncbi:hypothetical protein J7T55_015580 [Diaporthe amygdali]|uniref:uncharacterized protein n=1 Tax=Phomopsis amygdali TaxID=1214568 RepID=UPI0022FE04EB|nr:uncharacterized protein J7T55_015580 [Diaporthe amygdali]KAJ0120845.1 hypothetical protein J7T55_015580 [Diaporthe amygdali]
MKTTLTSTLLLAASLVKAAAAAPPSEDLSEDSSSNGTFSNIERRYGHATGRVICGKYANGDYIRLWNLAYALDNKDADTKWDIGPKACNRVTCWDTTAIYVCNDNDHQITVTGKDISITTVYIRNHCCGATGQSFISGQQFTPWGWNTNIGYGNCRDPPSIRPHMAGGEGVNKGDCLQADIAEVGF